MSHAKICVLLLVVIPAVLAQTNYCNPSLCRGSTHVACDSKIKEISLSCKSPQVIEITPAYKEQIVNKHNLLRNQVAKGFDKFPTAARMATMVWDDELAKLAVFNVKQCQMKHDQCRNTKNFSHAGQNIVFNGWYGKTMSVSEVIDLHIDMWFQEYKICPASIIEHFHSKGENILHFTTMMQDKSTHVGCAIMRFIKGDYLNQLMTCNYAFTNILGEPVYRTGPTASECATGTNQIFTSLCSVREKYNVNPF